MQYDILDRNTLTTIPALANIGTSGGSIAHIAAANGWQTKITPDSRALIKLGLGPDHKGLLNPETANIPSPHELGVDSPTQPGGAADSQ